MKTDGKAAERERKEGERADEEGERTGALGVRGRRGRKVDREDAQPNSKVTTMENWNLNYSMRYTLRHMFDDVVMLVPDLCVCSLPFDVVEEEDRRCKLGAVCAVFCSGLSTGRWS
jgi:hypothetical protein